MFPKLALGSLREVALNLLETWYDNSYECISLKYFFKNTVIDSVFDHNQ